jgi:hypothetical protein
MGPFKKSPKVGADGYQRQVVQGYPDKGKVAKLLGEGWEIENVQQVQLGGTTLKQATYHLKRKAPEN